MEVLEATTIFACFEKFLKSSFVCIGISAIALYVSCLKRNNFLTFHRYAKPVLISGFVRVSMLPLFQCYMYTYVNRQVLYWCFVFWFYQSNLG